MDKKADPTDTGPVENFPAVWSFPNFGRQLLAGEVQLLVQAGAPARAVTDIVNDAVEGDVHGDAVAIVAAKLSEREGAVCDHSVSILLCTQDDALALIQADGEQRDQD